MPLYPGLDHESYHLVRDPWNDGRTVVRVLPSPGWAPKVQTRTVDALPRTASPQSIERTRRYGL